LADQGNDGDKVGYTLRDLIPDDDDDDDHDNNNNCHPPTPHNPLFFRP
jgi:hypothetical protein